MPFNWLVTLKMAILQNTYRPQWGYTEIGLIGSPVEMAISRKLNFGIVPILGQELTTWPPQICFLPARMTKNWALGIWVPLPNGELGIQMQDVPIIMLFVAYRQESGKIIAHAMNRD